MRAGRVCLESSRFVVVGWDYHVFGIASGTVKGGKNVYWSGRG